MRSQETPHVDAECKYSFMCGLTQVSSVIRASCVLLSRVFEMRDDRALSYQDKKSKHKESRDRLTLGGAPLASECGSCTAADFVVAAAAAVSWSTLRACEMQVRPTPDDTLLARLVSASGMRTHSKFYGCAISEKGRHDSLLSQPVRVRTSTGS